MPTVHLVMEEADDVIGPIQRMACDLIERRLGHPVNRKHVEELHRRLCAHDWSLLDDDVSVESLLQYVLCNTKRGAGNARRAFVGTALSMTEQISALERLFPLGDLLLSEDPAHLAVALGTAVTDVRRKVIKLGTRSGDLQRVLRNLMTLSESLTRFLYRYCGITTRPYMRGDKKIIDFDQLAIDVGVSDATICAMNEWLDATSCEEDHDRAWLRQLLHNLRKAEHPQDMERVIAQWGMRARDFEEARQALLDPKEILPEMLLREVEDTRSLMIVLGVYAEAALTQWQEIQSETAAIVCQKLRDFLRTLRSSLWYTYQVSSRTRVDGRSQRKQFDLIWYDEGLLMDEPFAKLVGRVLAMYYDEPDDHPNEHALSILSIYLEDGAAHEKLVWIKEDILDDEGDNKVS